MYLIHGIALIASCEGDRAALNRLHKHFLAAADNGKNIAHADRNELRELAQLALTAAHAPVL